MPDEALTQEQRRVLSAYCRTPEKRILARALDEAHRWEPFIIKHPETGALFNDGTAWDFIADCLEAGHPIRRSPADKEKGRPFPALEMIVDVSNSERRLYMKVAFIRQRDMMLGLSFHYSTEEYRND